MTFAPQGAIEFPGIAAPLNASFTLTPGVTPSVCTMRIAPQPAWSPRIGPLTVSYGSTSLRFADCIIDRVEAAVDGNGHTVWDVSILDRRWKWNGMGRISGYYNVRRETGAGQPMEIVEGTEKSPRELAKLCLQELGETNYSVDDMPDDPRPEIEWDYTTPAQALAQLCDDLQCAVVLTRRDTIRIVKRGQGAALPMGNTFLSGGEAIDPPEQPDEIVVVTAPRVYQLDLELEYVGLDLDQHIRPIDKLSYHYENSAGQRQPWHKAELHYMLGVPNPAARKLAVQSVYRWARIKMPIAALTITDLDRILPLLPYQLRERKIFDFQPQAEGKYRIEPSDPIVYGQFTSTHTAGLWSIALKGEHYLDDIPSPYKKYHDGFSVDTQTGIVKFADPVYYIDKVNHTDGKGGLDNQGVQPAKLWLRICFHVRDPDTRGWLRWEYRRTLPGAKNGTKPAYYRHDDLQPKWWKLRASKDEEKEWEDNLTEVDKQGDYYIREHLRLFQTQVPQSAIYSGFEPLEPDGMISSVTWWISDEGFAMTRAMRGKDDPDIPTYAERRLWERLAEARRQEAKTKTEAARQQRRARA